MTASALRTQIERAARSILNGGLVAYPTESVFGLGCDPANERAVHALLTLKQRSLEQGLIVVAADEQQLQGWVDDDPQWLARARPTWPGPTTWIMPKGPKAPTWICGAHDGIAVRITSHPVAHALAAIVGFPIVSTSANVHGEPALTTPEAVQQRLGDALQVVVHAPVGGRDRPSEIRDVVTNRIVRNG